MFMGLGDYLQVVEQLESIESDLVASDGKPHLVQSLTDSEHHQQLNPEMKAIENVSTYTHYYCIFVSALSHIQLHLT